MPFNLLRVIHYVLLEKSRLSGDPESAGTSELKLHEMVTTFAIPSISECEAQEKFVFQDRRQRRGKGNRYLDITVCLRWPFFDIRANIMVITVPK